MKNLLMIITKLSNGGSEKAINLLANSLANLYNVKLVTFDNSNQDYKSDVEIIDLKTKNSKNILKKFINFIKRFCKIKKIKKLYKIDCTISFLPGPNIINCITRTNDKVIISVRNMQSKKEKSYFRDLANQFSFCMADKIITVCESVKNDIIKHYKVRKEKICTIYNTYNKAEIDIKKTEKVEEKELKGKKIVITIGRLIYQKGQWHLIRAFKGISKKEPEARLVILGRGESEGFLREVIKSNGLEEKVFLYGYKENPYKYLYNSSVFVLPSLFEGMSNTLLEAMACGTPIVTTDCEGANNEILNEKCAIITKCCDGKLYKDESLTKEEEELEKAILKVLKDKIFSEYLKINGKEKLKKFEKEAVLKKWINVIEEMEQKW